MHQCNYCCWYNESYVDHTAALRTLSMHSIRVVYPSVPFSIGCSWFCSVFKSHIE